MKKIFIAAFLVVLVGLTLSAQVTGTGVDPSMIGVDSAQQKLKRVSVSKFEDPGFWQVSMPFEQGLVTQRRLNGGPAEKTQIPDEKALGIDEIDENVLGVRVNYFRRGPASFAITPVRPLPVEGIVKTVSVWVIGRNYNHDLKLVIEDFFGNRAELFMGKLNFTGWKELKVAIPPHIVQRDYHYNNSMGLKILGFKVDCDLSETIGSYYIYFDGLEAVTDLFAEESRDPDDIPDTW